jgi:hypothetical protein
VGRVIVRRRELGREMTLRRPIETGVELLATCICWAIFDGRAVTALRSKVGSTPDGGTKTGAGGGVTRTPEGGGDEGPDVGLVV